MNLVDAGVMISLLRSSVDPLSCVISVQYNARVIAKHDIVSVSYEQCCSGVVFGPVGAVSAVSGYHVREQQRLFVAEYDVRVIVLAIILGLCRP